MITLESNVRVGEQVAFELVAGEAVLLNLDTGQYYGLDEVGTRMWSLLTEQGAIRPAYEALLHEYDVTAEQLQHDLLQLIEDLVTRGLLEVVAT